MPELVFLLRMDINETGWIPTRHGVPGFVTISGMKLTILVCGLLHVGNIELEATLSSKPLGAKNSTSHL